MAPAKKKAAKKPATAKGVAPVSLDSFKCRKTLKVGNKSYEYFSLKDAEKNGLKNITRLPYSLKVLLENLLRYEDGRSVKKADIEAMAKWLTRRKSSKEIAFRPARVLMQDFTGVPGVVDLAAMRDAMAAAGGNPDKINPLAPVDLVIDHSVMVDHFGGKDSFKKNVNVEYERNGERYEFLRWGSEAFNNLRVVPPGTGICHQVNLEYRPRPSGPRRKSAQQRVARPRPLKSPILTASSAQTATPPWSMVCLFWGGALAASKLKQPCSASRSPC